MHLISKTQKLLDIVFKNDKIFCLAPSQTPTPSAPKTCKWTDVYECIPTAIILATPKGKKNFVLGESITQLLPFHHLVTSVHVAAGITFEAVQNETVATRRIIIHS